MIYLLDTHALYWFFENPKKLSIKILNILKNEDIQLLIPSIVLAELKYIFKKHKILNKFNKIFSEIINDTRCFIIPFDIEILDRLQINFEMHDSIIIASAKYFEEIGKNKVSIITRDKTITEAGIISTIW